MFQPLMEILVILDILAALAIVAAIVIEGWHRLLWRSTLGRGFWLSLVGGTILLTVLLAILVLLGALTLSVGY